MRCLACGGEMVLIEVVEDKTVMVRGFEHQTFECPACNEIDRRHAFKKQDTEHDTEAVGTSPPIATGITKPGGNVDEDNQ